MLEEILRKDIVSVEAVPVNRVARRCSMKRQQVKQVIATKILDVRTFSVGLAL